MPAAITVTPESGFPNTNVTVNGTGWSSGETLTIVTIDSIAPSSQTIVGQVIPSTGDFSGAFIVPTSLAGVGEVTVSVTGSTSGAKTADFTVDAYPTIKDVWKGEQWGDGGVYWYNNTPLAYPTVSGVATTVTANLTDGFRSLTTHATTTVLTDSTLSLATNALKGEYLTYLSGPAANLSLQIISNTADTITTAAFGATPTEGGGDVYQITKFAIVTDTSGIGTATESTDGNVSWNTWN